MVPAAAKAAHIWVTKAPFEPHFMRIKGQDKGNLKWQTEAQIAAIVIEAEVVKVAVE